VYFAERKQADGKDWHNICFNKYYKQKKEEDTLNRYGSYRKSASTSSLTSSKSTIKKCPDCDAEVEEGTRFCTSCGYKFQ